MMAKQDTQRQTQKGSQGESEESDAGLKSSVGNVDETSAEADAHITSQWESMDGVELVQKAGAGEEALIIDIDGFEGPLDFLLALARQQKLDLTKISILALAEQYLDFIERAKALRLELAADYLVMAAWLAYLKSRLLIPDMGEEDEPSGEELAAMLAERLKKLDAMRVAAKKLTDRARQMQDFFPRGMPEDISMSKKPQFAAALYDLLTAYAAQRQRQSVSLVHVRKREVWSLQEARDVLTRLIGSVADWTPVDELLRNYLKLTDIRSTAIASSFAASLELVREGQLELKQSSAFGTIYVRNAKQDGQ